MKVRIRANMKNWIKKLFETDAIQSKDGLHYWRLKVLEGVLLLTCLFGLGAYIFGMYMSIAYNAYFIAVVDTLGYGFLLYTYFNKKLSYQFRSWSLISVPILLSLGLLLVLGPSGAGHTYLIGFSILASLLLGFRGAINSLLIILLIISSIALGLYLEVFGSLMITEYTPILWITITLNSFAIAAIASLPLAMLVNGLEKIIDKQSDLQYQLEEYISQIAIAKAKAEESDHLKTKFLANMSHEVRTPLNAILGFSELALNEMYHDDKERTHYLKTIYQNGNYLLKIIENILDFSMIESKQLKSDLALADLNELLNDLNKIYQLKQNKHLKIVFEIPPANSMIKTDANHLKQVFINLINNALKYTNKGEIRIGTQRQIKTLNCFVKDTGIGIEAKDQKAIFERFTKLENEDKFRNGTGLGLAISKGIVENLGGTIWVESEAGRGATFHFTIKDYASSASIE